MRRIYTWWQLAVLRKEHEKTPGTQIRDLLHTYKYILLYIYIYTYYIINPCWSYVNTLPLLFRLPNMGSFSSFLYDIPDSAAHQEARVRIQRSWLSLRRWAKLAWHCLTWLTHHALIQIKGRPSIHIICIYIYILYDYMHNEYRYVQICILYITYIMWV